MGRESISMRTRRDGAAPEPRGQGHARGSRAHGRGLAAAPRARCRGIAVVEFVIVLPLCLMLLMATGEFGRAFMQYDTLEKAVRDGARYGAGKARVGSTGVISVSAQLATEVQNLVVYGNKLGTGAPLLPNFTPSEVTVTDAGGESIQVTAAYPYSPIFGFVPAFLYGSGTDVSGYVFQASTIMRAL